MASKLDKIRQAKEAAKAREQILTPTEDFDSFVLNIEENIGKNINISEDEANSVTTESLISKIDSKIDKNDENVSRETFVEQKIHQKELQNDIKITEKISEQLEENKNKNEIVKGKNEANNNLPEIKNISWNLNEMTTWGTNIKQNCNLTYDFYAMSNEIKRYDLLNNIIQAEKEWLKLNPGFPSKEFVLSNLTQKNNSNKDDGYIRTTFLVTTESKDFLKSYSKRCGMKMYEYVEYLIEKYLGDVTK